MSISPVIKGKITKTFLVNLFKILNTIQIVYINKDSNAITADKEALLEILKGYNDYLTKYKNELTSIIINQLKLAEH
ncbi:hypothetical protein Calkro_2505 [Caldicellulosiruptor kronotskyensis 2002]|uniref:Uncharacterized protein n=1 Tax=Caldicellulosiruptor kronotskyensis (strain DSM 18902 / VKM B-2412 / 2002) TaxID=632348 RepID=E4SHT4_CALK2|nr:hypothetical protein [Caldicellulosiruptor kronotskyensis]ADQ47309.1 hypothetical protein Calkro_2505 [Caldicellulosiruptor kronotskyensis 2002]